jgi:hypothetical protein
MSTELEADSSDDDELPMNISSNDGSQLSSKLATNGPKNAANTPKMSE